MLERLIRFGLFGAKVWVEVSGMLTPGTFELTSKQKTRATQIPNPIKSNPTKNMGSSGRFIL